MLVDQTPHPTRFLACQPWFTQLPQEARERIAARVSVRSGRKGEVMLHAGDPVRGWYAVTSGLVTLQSQSAQGRLSVFLGAQAGDWFGEGSALKDEPRRYDVVALRDSELLCLPRAEFDELRATSLAFNQLLVAHLNLRLGQAMAMIEAERIRSPEQRVALYLGRLFWPGLRKLRLSQEELANLVGLSRQTVNRVLKQFESEGLVSLEFGRIGIVDESALAERAGTRP
ncbi:MAG: Crp/Fnr family transcriptional regulator [Ramlibacter sp.]|nr:Crp/Fnr family transcriptional regulator [Ramlibacter sp.]MBX3660661.1 Crp/Fnr family transcriptional regulator [Ramlibacter sp.]